jgi:hypothetical protein
MFHRNKQAAGCLSPYLAFQKPANKSLQLTAIWPYSASTLDKSQLIVQCQNTSAAQACNFARIMAVIFALYLA